MRATTLLFFRVLALLLVVTGCDNEAESVGTPPFFEVEVLVERSDAETGVHLRYRFDVLATPSGGEEMAHVAIGFSKDAISGLPRVVGRSAKLQKWKVTTKRDPSRTDLLLLEVDGTELKAGVAPGEEAWIDVIAPLRTEGATLSQEVFMNTRDFRTIVRKLEVKSLKSLQRERK